MLCSTATRACLVRRPRLRPVAAAAQLDEEDAEDEADDRADDGDDEEPDDPEATARASVEELTPRSRIRRPGRMYCST